MSAATGRRYRVSGHVQGVYFRRSAQIEAQRLGLGGWVRNLADGSVEAYAVGPAGALDAFERWLRRGPRHARVERVVAEPAVAEPHADFTIG